jgi:hypothetical protein
MLTLLSKIMSQQGIPQITGLEYLKKYFTIAEYTVHIKDEEAYRRQYGEERAHYLGAAQMLEMYLAIGYDTAKIVDKEPPEPKKSVKANG